MNRPALAVSLGCPAGIGPQLAVRAGGRRLPARCVLVGDHQVVRRAATRARLATRRLVVVSSRRAIDGLREDELGLWADAVSLTEPVAPGRPSAAAGAAALSWIDQACDLVVAGVCDGLVTGPVSKAVIARSAAPGAKGFAGHTEHLARRVGASEVVMAFHGRALTTALVTTHLPIAEVASHITAPRVAASCYWLAQLLLRLGQRRPRIVVAALNPHGGEAGLLGREERRRIVPGIKRALGRLVPEDRVSLDGPMGAESAFRLAASGSYDGVVAMYHDQATIPCKLLGFGDMVNVTLGLGIIRTSVDHGTAYEIAGHQSANPRSMVAAIRLAARLCDGRRPAPTR